MEFLSPLILKLGVWVRAFLTIFAARVSPFCSTTLIHQSVHASIHVAVIFRLMQHVYIFVRVGFIYLEKYVTIFTWKGNTSIQVNVLPFHHGVFFVSQILNLFRVTKLSANSQQFRVSHC